MNKIFSVFIALVLSLFCVVSVNADKLCVRNRVAIRNSRVRLKNVFRTTASPNCPSGYSEVVDASVFKGDRGPQGVPGKDGYAGMLNLRSCREENVVFPVCNEGKACPNSVKCGGEGTSNGSEVNDYMIHYNWWVSEDAGYVTEVTPIMVRALDDSAYPTGVVVTTASETGMGDHTPYVGIVCCLPY